MGDSDKKIIEALLFASPEPLTQSKVNGVFNPETPNLKKVVDYLNKKFPYHHPNQ